MESEKDECVFGKIARHELPADIIYEDEYTVAFIDNAPCAIGHTLVIPKRHYKNIFDIDPETLGHVMETVRKLAPIVRDAVDAKGVQINSNHEEAAGQVVFHLHFHIIPRHDRSEFEFWPKIPFSPEESRALAEKIKSCFLQDSPARY